MLSTLALPQRLAFETQSWYRVRQGSLTVYKMVPTLKRQVSVPEHLELIPSNATKQTKKQQTP
jgi:hypothetical protein